MKIPIKILIVEDDEINQKILSMYLSDYESVVITDCGEEAIRKCNSNDFDLVLMDIKLKNGNDGIKILKEIKDIENLLKETGVFAELQRVPKGRAVNIKEALKDYWPVK